MKECSLSGCTNPLSARMLCRLHYNEARRNGQLPVLHTAKHRLSSIDPDSMTADCAHCGHVSVCFRRNRNRYECRTYKNQRKLRSYIPKPRIPGAPTIPRINRETPPSAHGLTFAQAKQFRAGKVCAICGSDKNLMVDHCHKLRLIRGVLCGRCNWMLGMAADNPETLRAGAAYLENPHYVNPVDLRKQLKASNQSA